MKEVSKPPRSRSYRRCCDFRGEKSIVTAFSTSGRARVNEDILTEYWELEFFAEL